MKRIVRFFGLPLMASALLCCSKEAGTMTEAAPLDKEILWGGGGEYQPVVF